MTATIQTFPLINVRSVLDAAMKRLDDFNSPFALRVRDAAVSLRASMKIEWNSRLTRCAGKAMWMRNRITGRAMNFIMELSPKLLQRVDPESQVNTVTHEFAHLIQAHMNGNSDHGGEWQTNHKMMGGTGEQFHSINREGLYRNIKRFFYMNSANRMVVLTSTKHNQLKSYLVNNGYRLVEVRVYQGNKVVETIKS